MFKKILQAIEKLSCVQDNRYQYIVEELRKSRINDKNVASLTELLNYYTNLSDQVITEKYENDNNTFETVVLIPYRGKPTVLKDGKKVSFDKMTSFCVDWSFGSKTEVTVRSE